MKKDKKDYTSKNLKEGFFKEDELVQYETKQSDIETILKYQKLIPVLQEDDAGKIDARTLHNQLNIGKDFTSWIKDRIVKYDFEEDIDYLLTLTKTGERKNVIIHEYLLSIDMAKELAMVQNNEMGKITRKYFIAIERAFKNRYEWNKDRKDTLIHCKALQHMMMKYRPQLLDNKPSWAFSVQQAEFCMFNNIILGMSSNDYKKLNGLSKSYPIRNNFSEDQLEYIAGLEEYDAKLIGTQFMFEYDKRQEILTREYINLSKMK